MRTLNLETLESPPDWRGFSGRNTDVFDMDDYLLDLDNNYDRAEELEAADLHLNFNLKLPGSR